MRLVNKEKKSKKNVLVDLQEVELARDAELARRRMLVQVFGPDEVDADSSTSFQKDFDLSLQMFVQIWARWKDIPSCPS